MTWTPRASVSEQSRQLRPGRFQHHCPDPECEAVTEHCYASHVQRVAQIHIPFQLEAAGS